MRYLLFTLLAFACLDMSAQNGIIVTAKGDTLNKTDAKGRKQGPWVLHFPALRTEPAYDEEGVFVNDLKEGVWKRFTPDGDLLALEQYRHSMKNGKCQYYTPAGDPLREESWRAVDSAAPYDTVAVYDLNDPTKIVKFQLVKMEPKSYKDGTWTYYEFDPMKGTTTTYSEEYHLDRLKVKPSADIADLKPAEEGATGTDGKPAEAKKKEVQKPKEVMDFEKANSGKKRKYRDGATGG